MEVFAGKASNDGCEGELCLVSSRIHQLVENLTHLAHAKQRADNSINGHFDIFLRRVVLIAKMFRVCCVW